MTLAEAGEIFAYWEENPPPHLAVQIIARLLGWTPRKPAAAALAMITAAPPPGLVVTRGGLNMPPPLLDPAALRTRNRARAVPDAGSTMRVLRDGRVAASSG